MFKNILVPIAMDHGDIRDKAVAVAKSLRAEGGSITLLHVLDDFPPWITAELPEGLSDRNRDEARRQLHEIAEGLGGNIKVSVVYGPAGRTIVSYSDENEFECVVLASHRPELSDYLLGSTAATVARHANASVMVVR